MADQRALEEREERRKEQERFMAVYEEVKNELLRIPGVVKVGLGLRERGGQLTRETAFRVYVKEKLPESEIPPENRIPKEVRGFPIDVIKVRQPIPIIGFNDEDDGVNYKTKVGGIRVGNEEAGSGTGTLGCFARLNSDGSVVLLSNHHVLFHAGGKVGDGVGQPDWSGSWCCVCNEIAEVVAGDVPNDCAIARLKPDVKFAPKVRRIKKADGTVELTGIIAGSDTAVKGDEVWKVGARTGLTRGTIAEVVGEIEIHPMAPFTRIANEGDSGSVVVDFASDKVVGLLYGIDRATGTKGVANHIGPILISMGITIIPTDETQDYDVKGWNEERLGVAGPPTPGDVFAAVADRLRMTETGAELLNLFRRHRNEISELINHRRPVTVAWQRGQGPAYLAATMRSVREPAYRLPESLNGVTRQEMIERLFAALTRHGSDRLRADLESHADALIRIWLESSTMEEAIAAWERSRAPALLR